NAAGCTVVHVVSSVKFAQKAEAAGVDAVVAEGFEAGGHNGREETTTFTLIPAVRQAIELPLIAAGGIATGAGMLAAMALGADGVQVGSRFAITDEASSHLNYKNRVVEAGEGSTAFTLKELTPVRLLKSPFYQELQKAYAQGANVEELRALLGKGRAKKGIFEGDWESGEFEIGQAAQLIDAVQSAETVVKQMIADYHKALSKLKPLQR
ncbi:MAG: NAD(P)H-dependent flavin oxidoreductase, partial [Flavobacteriaceae bacterium]